MRLQGYGDARSAQRRKAKIAKQEAQKWGNNVLPKAGLSRRHNRLRLISLRHLSRSQAKCMCAIKHRGVHHCYSRGHEGHLRGPCPLPRVRQGGAGRGNPSSQQLHNACTPQRCTHDPAGPNTRGGEEPSEGHVRCALALLSKSMCVMCPSLSPVTVGMP